PMHSFTIRLHAKCGCDTFHFHKIYTPNGMKYHVAASTHKNKNYFFNMELKGDRWVIVSSPMPLNCILQLEEALSKAIVQNHENNNDVPSEK
ncbi:MAG TPA: hypothetical protein VM888_08260, partial [Chitinophagaceae bacterium]|nr:hypothetical protein [Chitinophagaceae bacterium]